MSMLLILKLALIAILPVLLSVFLYGCEKKTKLLKMSYKKQQIIYGVMFGLLAILGTEYSVDVNGIGANARDAAPICAGLIFGGPAGIIAGMIGGLERWFAVLWGAGEYTRLACSISTCLSGVIAGLLRKYLFDNKIPSLFFSFAIGVVAEVFHMLMIFVVRMDDARNGFAIVENVGIPMIAVNSIAVFLAVWVITKLGKIKVDNKHSIRQISELFQRGLLVCVCLAFVFTSIFTFSLQDGVMVENVTSLLELNLSDVMSDIQDASDANLLKLTETVAGRVGPVTTSERLEKLAKEYDIAEINIVDQTGIITKSTNSTFVGYDMDSGEQSREFMVLTGNEKELVQKYQPISANKDISRKYAGVKLPFGGYIQVGYDAAHFQKDIDQKILNITANRHLENTGSVIIADEDRKIVSQAKGRTEVDILATGLHVDNLTMGENKIFESKAYGEECYAMYAMCEGYMIVAVLPISEARFSRNMASYLNVMMEVIVFAALFILIYVMVKRVVVDKIRKVNYSLGEITGGNLDIIVDVRDNEEFASLSDDINSTVTVLKQYIEEAASRIDKELEFAKNIQESALPSVFPPFPNRKEFEIYAQMDTAKEVGGDFYDFYFVDENKLAFLMADVSGKGIPAAMFMMTSKSILKGYAESGKSVEQVFIDANNKLCESNDAGMFVTVWMGILDLTTGLIEFANAGHNPPLVRHADGEYEYHKMPAGLVLAGMEGIPYRKCTLQLEPGDEIYIYTDGVTEATDANNQLYGEERLKTIMNTNMDQNCDEICKKVKADVDLFVGEASQFDDITMLSLKYFGPEKEV